MCAGGDLGYELVVSGLLFAVFTSALRYMVKDFRGSMFYSDQCLSMYV